MPEGAAEGQQLSQSERRNTPVQEQDSGWSEHAAALAGMGNAEVQAEKPAQKPRAERSEDELLASARKEFSENIQ